MGRASREKGAKGEREVVAVFREAGIGARRTAMMQTQAGASEADVALEVQGLHIEVKRTERLALKAAMRQAVEAAGPGQTPAVAHRSNREPWLVTLPLEDFAAILRAATM